MLAEINWYFFYTLKCAILSEGNHGRVLIVNNPTELCKSCSIYKWIVCTCLSSLEPTHLVAVIKMESCLKHTFKTCKFENLFRCIKSSLLAAIWNCNSSFACKSWNLNNIASLILNQVTLEVNEKKWIKCSGFYFFFNPLADCF